MSITIRTDTSRDEDHQDVCVAFDDGPVVRYCGVTWCTGKCGLPALVIPGSPDWKAAGNAVANGGVMQSMRLWTGARVEVPEEYRAEMMKRWWL